MEKQVYTIAEMQQMLNISREAAYKFAKEVFQNQKPFIIFKIGTTYRISKTSFDHWVHGQQSNIDRTFSENSMV